MPRLRITFNRVAGRTSDASATKFTSRVLEGLPVSGGLVEPRKGIACVDGLRRSKESPAHVSGGAEFLA